MFDYRTRLVAALETRGAKDDLIQAALESLGDANDENFLIEEYGEPELYARRMQEEEHPGGRRNAVVLIGATLSIFIIVLGFLHTKNRLDWLPNLPIFAFLACGLAILLLSILLEFTFFMMKSKRKARNLSG